ncbi:chemotaxis protein CheA [Aureimonas endophytica]|uniref:Chemotaxis protein CheA n=1 Tax=Aureimonas endophytica TaxID=2027858 RepID=A0A916ZTD9_9HYPH|nr:chemotaxis protein CheA [Aureimonas endophytica]GGE12971.1 chemotaxis protein CheA [Aureimonas endophytica]
MNNRLLAQFIPEARDLIQDSISGLLRLEGDPEDKATINEVFRAVHTLKGSSGLFEVVALTKLVHAAEDLLGAIRLGEMGLGPELVDGLLESLDRVNAWLDHLESHEALPGDADGVSASLAGSLRRFSPGAAEPAPSQAAPRPAKGLEPGWLAPFTEAGRQDALRRIAGGESVLALAYRPNESCFFNGTDPLGTMLQIADLVALDARPREPLAALADLDPYRCLLDFQALTTASRTELEHLFRYDIEEVEIREVAAADLVHLFGAPDDQAVWSDFAELGAEQLAARDFAGLGRAAAALVEMRGAGLRPVSALRWIRVALDCGPSCHALLPGLVAAAGGREPRPVPAETGGAPAFSDDATGRMAARLLETQRRNLTLTPDREIRLPAIRRTLAGLAKALDIPALEDALEEAGEDADRLLDRLAAFGPAPKPAARPPVAGGAPAPMPVPVPDAADGAAAPVAATAAAAGRQLKVDQGKVDLLMNLIGELIVSKNSLPFLARRAEDVYGSREMAREIKEQYAVIDRLAQEMQGAVMQVRMLPVSEVFVRFPRLVRDLSRKLGKRIALSIEGGETAADKTIVEALGDPLLHIMRNSLDHGIEGAEARRASGKPEEATIRIRAFQEADSVVIEIADDGRGIDPEKIRAAAVAKGVIGAEAAGRLSDQEAINLIYKPGFSTAAEVSDLSGRGVGMDVVLTTVERLGGSVSVTSRLGEGTATRLALPLSMAVTRVMVVEAGRTPYGIPMDLIVETVRVPRGAIRTIKRAETFVLRNSVIPLLRLATLLRLPDAAVAAPEDEAVLVCRVNGSPVGLVIDAFREGMEVLLKPLEGVLAAIRGYSGTALLGDGRVLLVLNLKELL